MKTNDTNDVDLTNSEKLSTREIAQEVARAVREDIGSAGREVKRKNIEAGMGIGMFGASGMFALAGVACMVVALVAGLDNAMPTWGAALTGAVIMFAAAAVFTLIGKKEIEDAVPPTPTGSMQKLKNDLKDIAHKVRN